MSEYISQSDIDRDPTLGALALTQNLDTRIRGRNRYAIENQPPIEDCVSREHLEDPYLGPILRAAYAHGRAGLLKTLAEIYDEERTIQRAVEKFGGKEKFLEAYRRGL